ncbi:MAG TPA: hypothetical protein VLA83_02220 [Candidatus Binatia bacterium]|nr:hypothetical protein [Candidatus Binatia bacterium]
MNGRFFVPKNLLSRYCFGLLAFAGTEIFFPAAAFFFFALDWTPGGSGCGFNSTLLAAEVDPTFCFGGSGCGFKDTLLAADVDPTFLCFGGSGCGFNDTLLAADVEPIFPSLGGSG